MYQGGWFETVGSLSIHVRSCSVIDGDRCALCRGDGPQPNNALYKSVICIFMEENNAHDMLI